MENLKHDVGRYLKDTLDISVKAEPWDGEGRLPFYLRNLYAFFQVSILNTPCLVMAPMGRGGTGPGSRPQARSPSTKDMGPRGHLRDQENFRL